MKTIKEIARLIVINVITLVCSIPLFIIVVFIASSLSICTISDYFFVPIAALWPWAIWKLSQSKYEVLFVTVSTLLGCLISMGFIRSSFYPECHQYAYEQTYLPLYVTIGTGLISASICLIFTVLKRRHLISAKKT